MYNLKVGCAFVRIPKVCGFAVSYALKLKTMDLVGIDHEQHPTAREYELYFSPEELVKFFKFSLVRNPWGRMVSLYHFFKYNRKSTKEGILANELDFNDWIQTSYEKKLCRWISPQYPRLLGKDGNLFVDFIGKYENLDKDWNTICEKLGGVLELSKVNVSKTPTKRPYQEYYDLDTQKLITEICQIDIEKFGYQFSSI